MPGGGRQAPVGHVGKPTGVHLDDPQRVVAGLLLPHLPVKTLRHQHGRGRPDLAPAARRRWRSSAAQSEGTCWAMTSSCWLPWAPASGSAPSSRSSPAVHGSRAGSSSCRPVQPRDPGRAASGYRPPRL